MSSKERLDTLSKGEGKITSFKFVSKTDCKSEWRIKSETQVSLKKVFDDLIGEGKVSTERSSRGFINADYFNFAADIGTLTVSRCEDIGLLKVENLIAIRSIIPVKWLEIRHVKLKVLAFYYDDLEQKGGKGLSRIYIDGYGFSYLGSTKREALVQFRTMNFDSKTYKMAGDSDVSIAIRFNNDEYKDTLHISVFLGIFGQSITSLYPEPPQMEISRLDLESLYFNRKGSKTHMIKGVISEANQYALYITGEVSGSNLLATAKNVYVLCQNDFSSVANSVNCALLSTIETSAFDFNSVLNDVDLTAISEDMKIFKGGKIPESLFFQSSKSSMDTLNAVDLQNEFLPFVGNENRHDKTSRTESMIVAGSCFRYKITNIGSEQTAATESIAVTNIAVNMFPGIDSVKFYLPNLGAIPMPQIPALITDADNEISRFKSLFGDQTMQLEYVEVFKSDIGNGFKFSMQLKSSSSNESGGFNFIPNFSFLGISQTSIKIIIEKNKLLQLEGAGEETMLKSISSYELGSKGGDITMSGEIKIRSREVLMDSLKEWMKGKAKIEGNIPFQGLQVITLQNLKYSATAGVDRIVFSGGALLGENSDSIFQMVLFESKHAMEVATCMYRENAGVSNFINSIYGKTIFTQDWLKAGSIGIVMHPNLGLQEISRFSRELCNIEDYAPKGGMDKITLFLNDFKLDDCEKHEDNACLFFKRAFKTKVTIKMLGIMRSNGLHLEGYTSKNMALGPNLFLTGMSDQNEMRNKKIRIKMIASESVNIMTLEGSLKFGGDTSKELPGKITIAGNNVVLEIPESTDIDYLDITQNDKLEFVRLTGTASSKQALYGSSSLSSLVMDSAMTLGSSGSVYAIEFKDRNLIKQYIDPATMEVKMYACVGQNVSLETKDVLKAFGEGKANIHGLLDKSKLKGLCMTYHESKEKWSIDDLGLEVESGLRITASLESTLSVENGKQSLLNAEIRIDDGKSVLCVLMPPQMWSMKERVISTTAGKNKVKVPRMEMYFKEDSRAFGPELCYEIPFVGEKAFGYLTGYIKTVGVASDGEVIISSLSNPSNMHNYVFEYSGSLFSQVEGSLRLDTIYNGQDLSDLKFKLKIDIVDSTQKALKEYVLQFTQERAAKATKQLNKAKEYLANFTGWKREYDEERIILLSEHQKNKNQFRRRKIERARSIQTFSKDCSHSCGYVHVPGWNVEEKCAQIRQGRYLRCMKYLKYGNAASNVGCVATCEAERVRSLVEARELEEIAKKEGMEVDKTQECLDLLQDVSQLINIYVEKMTDSVSEMEKVTKTHRNLALFKVDNINEKFIIERLDAEVYLDDLDDPSCLPFNIRAKVAFDENSDLMKSYSKVKRCLNGVFVKKLVEFIFEDMMKSDIEAMEKHFQTMIGRYASFEKILKRTSKSVTSRKIVEIEGAFKSCRSMNEIETSLRRRSIVESTLSSLTPSLFTIFRDSTVKAFQHNSPWSVSKRRDIFNQFLRTQKKQLPDAKSHPDTGEHPCSAARRAAVDYADIASYAHKWIKEQVAAKRTLISVKKYIIDGVNAADTKLNVSNYSPDEVENMQFWMNKAKEGVSSWLDTENSRIERHNKEGLALMKKELETVYTDSNHKTLRDFLTHRSSDGNTALKKANIETPSSSIFVDVNQNLLNMLESGKSLEDLASPVEEIIGRIDGLQKRTIQCNTLNYS